MDAWRRGSIKSTTFFRRLSLRRHKKLGNQVILLDQHSRTLGGDGQRHKREGLRDLDSSSCPNIIDRTDSRSDVSLPGDSRQLHKAAQTRFHREQPTDCGAAEPGSPSSSPPPDPSDPFLSFKVDLGLSLLEDVLQTLREQNPRDYAI